jgi:putative sigma-54 modulation protein
MNIKLQTQGFSLTNAIDRYARRRISFAIGNRFDQVRRVNVWLSDINGPRGGKDKRCLIQVGLAGGPDVVIDDTELDLYKAIDRASDRIRHTIARKLSRLAEGQRRLWHRKPKPAIAMAEQDWKDEH